MRKVSALSLIAALLLALSACSAGQLPTLDFNPPAPSSESGVQPDGGETGETPRMEDGDPAPVVTADEEGYALGYMGDTLRTNFFDMRLDSAYTCREFDGVTPEEGDKLLVAQITLYNYTDVTQPMFHTDFEIWWDEQEGESYEDAWAFPMYREENGEYYNLSDEQLPVEWEFSIHDTRTGTLLYSVPEGSSTYSVAFMEYYEDGTTGSLYEVRFSAPEQE